MSSQQLKNKAAQAEAGELETQARDIKGVKVLAAQVDGFDRQQLRTLVDSLRNKWKSAVVASPPSLVPQPARPSRDLRRGGHRDVHRGGGGAGSRRPRRAVADAGCEVPHRRQIPGQHHPADPGVHPDPPGLRRSFRTVSWRLRSGDSRGTIWNTPFRAGRCTQNDAMGRLADEDDDSVAWAAIGNEERDRLNAALAIRCAASRPAAPTTGSGKQAATRQEPPDQPAPLNDLAHLRN